MNVEPSHVIQWIAVWVVRCLEPRRMRTRMCFAGNLGFVSDGLHTDALMTGYWELEVKALT